MPLDPFVIDGELVIEIGKVPDFNALQMRLHPAESRLDALPLIRPPPSWRSTVCSANWANRFWQDHSVTVAERSRPLLGHG